MSHPEAARRCPQANRVERRADAMAVQRYPIRRPREKGGGFEKRYRIPVNTVIVDPSGRVTEYVRMKPQAGAWTDRRALSIRAEQMEAEIVMRTRELKQAEDEVRQSEVRPRFMAESMPQKNFHGKVRWRPRLPQPRVDEVHRPGV